MAGGARTAGYFAFTLRKQRDECWCLSTFSTYIFLVGTPAHEMLLFIFRIVLTPIWKRPQRQIQMCLSYVILNLAMLTLETNHHSHSVKLKSLTAVNIYKALSARDILDVVKFLFSLLF